MDNRKANNNPHPPTCPCTACRTKRLIRLRREVHPDYVSICPRCGKKSLWHNVKENMYECLNLKCRAKGSSPQDIRGKYTWSDAASGIQRTRTPRVPDQSTKPTPPSEAPFQKSSKGIPGCLVFIMVIFSLFLIGWGINVLNPSLLHSLEHALGLYYDTSKEISPKTGIYKDYYVGLVYSPGVTGGSGCYDSKGDFIVLINNTNAKNPTYSELFNFLNSDTTDEFPYELSIPANMFYSGRAEDNVDLGHIKDIIDGSTQPSPPRVCADFAERLHNNAEMAGIRCGYVIVDSLNHALDIFETTDKGLVFIDDTGKSNNLQAVTITLAGSITFGQASSWDKVAYVEDGKSYGLIDLKSALSFGLDYSGYEKWLATKNDLDNLETEYNKLAGGRLFVPQDTYNQLQNILSQEKAFASELGGFWGSLGTVTNYYVTWDGSWKDRH